MKLQGSLIENKMAIKYRAARIMSKLTGKRYEVDHVIPLQGELVSGLHHEDNLQILTKKQNCSKHNKFEPQFIEWGLKVA